MNTEQRITYSVGFKAVIDLVACGEVEFETGDIVAEVIELSDAFYEALSVRQGLGEDAPKAERSSKRTRSSSKRDSGRSGSTDDDKPKGFKDGSAKASDGQVKAIEGMLKANRIRFDRDGFEVDGVEYFWDELTMDDTQVFFDKWPKKY